MIEQLRQLGWGEYEARAYLALLRRNPATGYRIGKESGVPTAKVYEALARLVERGAARRLPATEEETAQYAPVPPEEVMAGLRARHTQMLEELTRELAAYLLPSGGVPAAWLKGRAPVLGRAHTMLTAAQKSVAIALPQRWESAFRAGLETARANRIRLDRVLMASDAAPNLFILVVDGAETLVGALGDPTDDLAAEAFAAHSPLLVGLCADYVRLRRALALVPEAVARLQRHDDWLDWEEAKQRRLLQTIVAPRVEPGAVTSH